MPLVNTAQYTSAACKVQSLKNIGYKHLYLALSSFFICLSVKCLHTFSGSIMYSIENNKFSFHADIRGVATTIHRAHPFFKFLDVYEMFCWSHFFSYGNGKAYPLLGRGNLLGYRGIYALVWG